MLLDCIKFFILVTINPACFNTIAKCRFIYLDRVLESDLPRLDQFDVLIVCDNSNGNIRIMLMN